MSAQSGVNLQGGRALDASLATLLQCPQTGQTLQWVDDANTLTQINGQLNSGQLRSANGSTLEGLVQALLVNADGAVTYPIVDGVIHLLEGSRLITGDGAVPVIAQSKGAEIQHQQMASYSEVYEYWTNGEGGPTRAIQKVLNARYGKLLAGASVLDIGNGGVPPEVQLGPEIASNLSRFIAADLSPHMLRRSGRFGDLLLADAFRLPLQDDAVDYVTVNNTLHHFGRHRSEDSQQKLGGFFAEALRVSRKGVIGVELLVPSLGLWAEQLLVNLIGFMPTYVYSANFYKQTLPNMGGTVTDFEVRSLNQLTSPWRIIPPVLDYTWFRVPTFMIPYSFLFFCIEK